MSDKDIKTMAVMIANRAADIEAARRLDQNKAKLRQYVQKLDMVKKQQIARHHPELLIKN